VHLVAANARTAITFVLYPGNAADAPEGRALLSELGPIPEGLPMLMDWAHERGTMSLEGISLRIHFKRRTSSPTGFSKTTESASSDSATND